MRDMSSVPWDSFPADANRDDRVSPHFGLYELTKSETASRLRIDNVFAGASELRSAVFLCRNVLEPIREALGRFSPNSVYRSARRWSGR
jgi:zinc D-Ala-D-Ala carboxypeptidase